jgi:hypothetical protein
MRLEVVSIAGQRERMASPLQPSRVMKPALPSTSHVALARRHLPQRRLLVGLLCVSFGALLGAISYRAHAATVFPGSLLRRFM